MLAIFPRALIHPLKQVASFGRRASLKAPFRVAYPLQQRLGLRSRKPMGREARSLNLTIGTANPFAHRNSFA